MPLPEELKIKFKNLVSSRSGLYFKDYDLKDLENSLACRMRMLKIDSALTYYNLLNTFEHKEEEFRELLNILTVNHTYFFRNEPQFKVLREKIIPELVHNKTIQYSPAANNNQKPRIRIWSAGCSTGEEPYSIAICLRESIPNIQNWDIQIMATDVSSQALDAARKGVYGKNSMRLANKEQRELYFEKQGDNYQIRDEIKRMVSFSFFNLMEDDYLVEFDIIFCRNVTIYFEVETIIAVMGKINRSLNDEGYLFIGYSESLQFISDKFKMSDWEDAIYYRKRKAKEIQPAVKDYVSQRVTADKLLTEISRKELEAELEKIKLVKPCKNIELLLTEIIKNLHTKRYYVVLELVEEVHQLDKDAVELYYFEAEALASLGRFEEARNRLKSALKLNPMFTPAYYLSGSLNTEEGLVDEAIKSFKQAIYLDENFSLAYFGLANIYKNKGNNIDAIREYRNTLKVLLKNSPDDIIAFSGGFSAVAIAGACKSNIERLKSV